MRIEVQRMIKQAERDLVNARKNIDATAESKLASAEAIVTWLRQQIHG
jgi:hypothetical protein